MNVETIEEVILAMTDIINTMLDEIIEDLRWLIELGERRVDTDYSQDREELAKLRNKYFGGT